jgi:hypothetical protein
VDNYQFCLRIARQDNPLYKTSAMSDHNFQTTKNVVRKTRDWFKTTEWAQWTALALPFIAFGVIAFIALIVTAFFYFHGQYVIKQEVQHGEQAAQQRAEQELTQQQAQKVSIIQSLFHFVTPTASQAVVLAVNTSSVPENLRDSLTSEIQNLLSAKYPTSAVLSDVALPDFYSTGYFDKAFHGDVTFLDTTGFFKHESILLLIQPQVEIKDATTVDGMKSCTLSLTCRSYSSTQTPSHTVTIRNVGAGFSEETSMKKALEAMGNKDQFNAVLSK